MGHALLWLLLAVPQVFRNPNDPSIDKTTPTVTIVSPQASGIYDAGSASSLSNMAGTSSSPNGIGICKWTNDLGGAGTATTSGNGDWTIPGILLTVGANVITITCVDANNNMGTALLTVTRSTGIPGVQVNPGEAIQALIDANPTGTQFVLKAGTHRLQALTPKTGDTFIGELSGATKLTIYSGGRVLTGWTQSGATWFVTGQTQEGTVSPTPPAIECDATHPQCIYPEDLFFDNAMKFREASLAAVGPGDWYFDHGAARIYVGDDPNGHVVETSVLPAMFIASAADNVTIKDMIVEKFASPNTRGALTLSSSALGGTGWTANNVEARWNHGGGVYTDSFSTAINGYYHHNCGYGILGAGEGILVESNEIAYNNVLPQSSTLPCGFNFYNGAVTKWVFTTDLVVRMNHSHHNYGLGLWTDINNYNTLYEDNLVEDNVSFGIFHEISYLAVIRNNTLNRNGSLYDFACYTSGAGIGISQSSNVEIYGNTFSANAQGITALADGRTGLGPPLVATHGAWSMTNLNVHNNGVTTGSMGTCWGRSGLLDLTGTGDAYTPAANNKWLDNDYVATVPTQTNWFFFSDMELTPDAWFNTIGMDAGGSFTFIP